MYIYEKQIVTLLSRPLLHFNIPFDLSQQSGTMDESIVKRLFTEKETIKKPQRTAKMSFGGQKNCFSHSKAHAAALYEHALTTSENKIEEPLDSTNLFSDDETKKGDYKAEVTSPQEDITVDAFQN